MMKQGFIWLLLSALLFGCTGPGTITKEDLSFLYDRNTTKLRIPARIYHVNDSMSELNFKLTTTDLLYRRGGEGDPFATLIRVHFDAFDANNRKVLLDSSTIYITDLTEDPLEEKELYGSLPMKRFKEKEVLVIIKAHDLYRDIQSIRRIDLSAHRVGHRMNFMLYDPQRGVPILRDQLSHPYPVTIHADQYKGKKLFGFYFEEDNSIPPPIFATRGVPLPPVDPDSIFTVFVNAEGQVDLNPTKTGIYHLQLDTSRTDGLSISVLGSAYPEVRTVSDMIEPLRYITSKNEFAKLTTSANQRQAIERLWMDLSGNKDRAKEVIRAYYNRVENANEHFTSYKEGWRTDRGLVHIVFGVPNTIHRSKNSETWIYGEESSILSMQFVFVRQNGSYSNNDLRLERDPAFKNAWYRNVESWRNGRIYQQ